MTRHVIRRALVACAVLVCVWSGSCAVNPATGKRQLSLIGESQEAQIGRENDRAITAEMGLYDDEALQRYVQELGRRLAARSERPQLDWTFRVVDDPVVNAFALPGGYIYVTRGILAHLGNEAELATVIGHEIGHVTARHSVNQMSKAQIAQGLLGVGSIVAPEQAERFGGVAQTGLGLAFLKFGRDDERQADDLGLRYLMATGYDPRPAAGVFDMLDRVSRAGGGGRVPGWMSTHPAPENRRERMNARIAALNYEFKDGSRGEAVYLERIDGVTFGNDPRHGYFENSLFLHPEMRFRIRFPDGWKLQNARQSVVGVSPEQDAVLQLTLADADTPEAGLSAFFAEEGMRRTGPSMGSISGLRTAGDGFAAESSKGAVQGRVGFVEHGGRVFQLIGYSAQHRWSNQESAIRRALASFDRVTEASVLNVAPRRLRVVRADRAMTLDELARRQDATVPTETLALINRIDPGERLAAGRSYKVVTGGPRR